MCFSNPTAPAMSQLFSRKYSSASTNRGMTNDKIGRGARKSGGTAAMAKKTCEADQMATAGAALLNKTRENRLDVFLSQKEMTRLSRTTITVAAEGPNRIAAAKTNVSETDNRAGIVGIRIVKEPLRSVRPARINH